MKAQDIIILLKLISLEQKSQTALHAVTATEGDPYSLRALEASLGISKSEIGASLRRSVGANLASKFGERIKVNRRNLLDFSLHGLKYVFPAELGAPQRGIATVFHAPMLKGKLISSGADNLVWPYSKGEVRGVSIKPLYKSVPEAALKDEQLYCFLALLDAVRAGQQREARLAHEIFEQSINLS